MHDLSQCAITTLCASSRSASVWCRVNGFAVSVMRLAAHPLQPFTAVAARWRLLPGMLQYTGVNYCGLYVFLPRYARCSRDLCSAARCCGAAVSCTVPLCGGCILGASRSPRSRDRRDRH
jgi:hypothetical protein